MPAQRPALLWFLFLTVALLILLPQPPRSEATALPAEAGWQVVTAGSDRVRLVWHAPAWEIVTERVQESVYSRIVLPGSAPLGAPDKPELPVAGTLLGVPVTDGLELTVISVQREKVTLPAPLPVLLPFGQDGGEEGEVAASGIQAHPWQGGEAFPAVEAEIGFAGMWRGQPVAQVQLYPVRLDATGLVAEIATEMVVELRWPAGAVWPEGRGESAEFEQMLARNLANYPQLNRPAPLPRSAAGEMLEHPEQVTTDPPALKLHVDETGLYVVTHDDLVAAGWDVATLDPTFWQLSHRGEPVAIQMLDGGDGRFDPGDSFRFYGEAYEDLYVRGNLYWLQVGDQPGLRMAQRDGAPVGAPIVETFSHTLHLEQDTFYWSTMTNAAPDEDFWFWGNRLSPNASGLDKERIHPFSLHHIAEDPYTATLRVQLKGYTALSHRSEISLNGVVLDDQIWSGFDRFRHEIPFDAALLQEGVNELKIRAVNSGATVDQWLFNRAELVYRDTFVAEEGLLIFGLEHAPATVSATGFAPDSEIAILDVTEPYQPVRITATTRSAEQVAWHLPEPGQWLAADPSAWRSPLLIEADTPSNLRSEANGADYIIITHADFSAAAEQLATHRAGEGLRTAVVQVQDIYDEFNGGLLSPEVIRDFLAWTYHHWEAPAPLYVVLLGDGSYDYKANLGGEFAQYIPPQMAFMSDRGHVPSDTWFVVLEGEDVLPEMWIGRLSVQTAEEAQSVVGTIIQYDISSPDPAFQDALFVADARDAATFEWLSEYLIGRLPTTWRENRVYMREYTTPTVRNDIVSHILEGQVWVNYSGHGAYPHWNTYRIGGTGYHSLHEINTNLLADALMPAFVTALSCSIGDFSIPLVTAQISGYSRSLAEGFQRNGAIGVWADSGLGYTSGQYLIMQKLLDVFFQDGVWGMGAAITEAQVRTVAQSPYWARMVETMILFGDPVSVLHAPPDPPVVTLTHPADGATEADPIAPVTVRFSKRMDPGSVALTDGSARTFTPTWNAEGTEAVFAHPMFQPGATVTLTVSGDDLRGQGLDGAGAPLTWSFVTTANVPTGVGLLAGETVSPAGVAGGLAAILLLLLLSGAAWLRARCDV